MNQQVRFRDPAAAIEQPNRVADPEGIIPNQELPQQQNRDLAGVIPEQHLPRVPQTTLTDFFESTRSDLRYTHQSSQGSHPVRAVYYNVVRLRAQFTIILERGLLSWVALRDFLPGTTANQTATIGTYVDALSAAMILMIYNLLRSRMGHHLFEETDRYRNRCPLDAYIELPEGLLYIVEQFNFCRTTQTYGNTDYIFHWDGENADTFGLAPNRMLNSQHLKAALDTLITMHVPMRRLNRACVPTSAWFTLYVNTPGLYSGTNVHTTFPVANYTLPQDIFLAIMVLGDTSVDYTHSPILHPGLRVSLLQSGAAANAVQSIAGDNMTAHETARFPTAANGTNPDVQLTIGQFEYTNIYPLGVSLTPGAPDVHGNQTYTRGVYVIGRGGAADMRTIDQIARGITNSDTQIWCEAITRHGVN